MQKSNVFWLFLLFSSLFVLSCAHDKTDNRETNSKIESKIVSPIDENAHKFHSKAKPGKWKNLNEDHEPIVEVKKTKVNYIIKIKSPIKNKSSHYLEFIILTDHLYKEKSKAAFKKTDIQPRASFTLPIKTKGEFYIILKCNLHDMWIKKIQIF